MPFIAFKYGLVAAAVAAIVTALSLPNDNVEVARAARPYVAAMNDCAHRTWPYLRCVGTSFGNPRVRLVTTDRLSP